MVLGLLVQHLLQKLGGLFVLAVVVENSLDGCLFTYQLGDHLPNAAITVTASHHLILCLVVDAGREALGLDLERVALAVQLRNIVSGQLCNG